MADTSRIEELRRRVQRDPASIAFAQLAEEYRRAGRCEEAIETCESGLAHHPGYLSARVTLGRALLETGNLEAAQLELKQVLRAAPENLAALRGLAEIHHRRGELREALAHYGAALELARHDPEIEHLVEQITAELEPAPEVPDGLSFADVKETFETLAGGDAGVQGGEPADPATPALTVAADAVSVAGPEEAADALLPVETDAALSLPTPDAAPAPAVEQPVPFEISLPSEDAGPGVEAEPIVLEVVPTDESATADGEGKDLAAPMIGEGASPGTVSAGDPITAPVVEWHDEAAAGPAAEPAWEVFADRPQPAAAPAGVPEAATPPSTPGPETTAQVEALERWLDVIIADRKQRG